VTTLNESGGIFEYSSQNVCRMKVLRMEVPEGKETCIWSHAFLL